MPLQPPANRHRHTGLRERQRGQHPLRPQSPALHQPLRPLPLHRRAHQPDFPGNGAPVGLGLLLKDHLCNQSKALFCPSSDQPLDANAQLANVGTRQAQCSYYYRHAGNTQLFDNPNVGLPPPDHIKLDDLGNNRNGLPIRALAIDTQFLCSPALATFGITPSTHHRQRVADILFSDGHAVSRPNRDACFVVDLSNDSNLGDAFGLILKVLEQADTEP